MTSTIDLRGDLRWHDESRASQHANRPGNFQGNAGVTNTVMQAFMRHTGHSAIDGRTIEPDRRVAGFSAMNLSIADRSVMDEVGRPEQVLWP